MPEPRINVTVRMLKDGIAEVDRIAAEDKRNRSDMMRILIGLGVTAWQQGKR